jgi:hypothetical protein
MAKPTAHRRHADRHGHAEPTVTQSAACETNRHGRCRGEVLSLLVPVGTRCGCQCHAQPLPPAWRATIADAPPCLDGAA